MSPIHFLGAPECLMVVMHGFHYPHWKQGECNIFFPRGEFRDKERHWDWETQIYYVHRQNSHTDVILISIRKKS